MHDEIAACETFTNKKINAVRSRLAKLLPGRDYAIVAGGSYARREASDQSDLDYFVICESAKLSPRAEEDFPTIKKTLKAVVQKEHATDGAFGKIVSIDQMGKNIGGRLDDNDTITRRVLFLLEGEWLYNEVQFNNYRNQIIGKYINASISEHQFCRFFLNDLIRYYRTVCVDFEHKTKEQGKAWGTRNIKLVFSRKLLYFSGILVAAETWQHTYKTKVEILNNLLSLTPIQRVGAVCGDKADPALKAYDEFLRKMGDPVIRKMTEKASGIRRTQPEEFRLLKNEGHHFSWMLAKLLKDTYDSSHPIHNALIV
jgi:predicted nucleotidyltransferase